MSDSIFAGGQLMDDLIRFVYNERNCRMLLIGDRAQLPPVGEQDSPALRSDVLRSYGLHVHECNLNEVLRQAEDSGILYNATRIRSLMNEDCGMMNEEWSSSAMANEKCSIHHSDIERSETIQHSTFVTQHSPKVRFDGFSDIKVVHGDELVEELASSYSRVGLDDTLGITRSNQRANIYNQGIRNSVLDREDELCSSDRLMIVKNNYYWMKTPSNSPCLGGEQGAPLNRGDGGAAGFIANGDIAVVQRVRNVHEQHGFRFAEVTMTFPDYDDYELTAMVILDTLTSEAPAQTREQQTLLYNKVLEDYADIRFKTDRMKKVKEDKYYNALQVKFAYAATCHKAQGGQWAHVYVDQGYMTDDMLGSDYLHWLYTAFTRATEKLFLVNWPERQVEGG